MFARSGDTVLNGLAPLTPSGTLDTTFGNGGTVANTNPQADGGFNAVAIQPDGKIVVVGTANSNTELFISRYLSQ